MRARRSIQPRGVSGGMIGPVRAYQLAAALVRPRLPHPAKDLPKIEARISA